MDEATFLPRIKMWKSPTTQDDTLKMVDCVSMVGGVGVDDTVPEKPERRKSKRQKRDETQYDLERLNRVTLSSGDTDEMVAMTQAKSFEVVPRFTEYALGDQHRHILKNDKIPNQEIDSLLADVTDERFALLVSVGKITDFGTDAMNATASEEKINVQFEKSGEVRDNEEQLHPIKQLPKYRQSVFAGIRPLNRIQSHLWNAAVLGKDQNVLLGAPTSAGKTSLALPTMIRALMSLYSFCLLLSLELTAGELFETEITPQEFIVYMHKYHWPETRARYLTAAFNRLENGTSLEWSVLERNNPANIYPSDFEIVRVPAFITLALLEGLQAHPAIKIVTPHRLIRRATLSTFTNLTDDDIWPNGGGRRKLLRQVPHHITAALEASALWDMGITGRGVKVAVFDTGLAADHPHFRRVKERTNWTNEKSLDDGVSHGTFVAGVIASFHRECYGLAPDAELHIYRVFTNTQISYTSWFLDAFNYAIFKKINVLNLSIGGPDYLDKPFVEKVCELSANRVIMVSAIGNDGPLYGTLNNPGDQSDVIGVGGINAENKVAKFSSRGMTTWELPYGYGRLKPDLVTYGSQVKGSAVKGCRSLSGTSVASPVVAGAIALILSGALEQMPYINPSAVKQVLIEGAARLPENNMFEQGHGKLNILRSMKLWKAYTPKVSLSPPYLDFTESYMWPYNSQPLFCGSTPVIVNVTILNAVAVSGRLLHSPTWHVYGERHKDILNVAITYSSVLWPWSGWMALHLAVNKTGTDFEGVVRGHVTLVVQNPSPSDESQLVNSTVHFPIKVQIIARPPRHKRILWDQYHNLRYPPGYIPRDNLKIKSDPLDWRADHIHTNFRDMYSHLRNAGYYVDVLSTPYTCFNASDYGTLIVVDPERDFLKEEIVKLENDIYERGLSIILFADWYNVTVMKKIKFFDENTRQWWIPDTGGANVPAINELLAPYGIAFGDTVAEGHYTMGDDHSMYFASGATLARFPSDSIVIGAELSDQGSEIINATNAATTLKKGKTFLPILGLLQAKSLHRASASDARDAYAHLFSHEDTIGDQSDFKAGDGQERNPMINNRNLLNAIADERDAVGAAYVRSNNNGNNNNEAKKPLAKTTGYEEGRLVVFGDSNCLDSAHMEKACFWLLDALLEYTMNSHTSEMLLKLNSIANFPKLGDKTHHKVLPLRLLTSSSALHNHRRQELEGSAEQRCRMEQWSKVFVVNKSELELPIPKPHYQSDAESSHAFSLDLKAKYDFGPDNLPQSSDKLHMKGEFNKSSLIWVFLLTFVVLLLLLYSFKKRHLWRLRRSLIILADI